MMSSLPVNDAQNNLQKLIDQVLEQGKLIIIEGDRGNAIRNWQYQKSSVIA